MTKKVVVVCANAGGPNSGFGTRVRLIAKALKNNGLKVTILRFYPLFREKVHWGTDESIHSTASIREIPVLPMSRFACFRVLSFIWANIYLYWYCWSKRVDYIQAESHEAAQVALSKRWLHIPVVVDFHGAVVEEARYAGKIDGKRDAKSWYEIAEANAVRAESYFFVSNALIEYLDGKYGFRKSRPAYVVPINVDEEFFREYDRGPLRKELGLEQDDVLLIYSGGDQKYQCIDEMMKVYERLATEFSNVYFLALSTTLDRFRNAACSIVEQKYRKRIFFRSARDKEEVVRYLNAADIAIMLRENEVLNIVSCPTKFGEYLAAGLPVICTPWAGHAPALVKKYELGVVIDPNNIDIAQLRDFIATKLHDRSRIRAVAMRESSWKHCEDVIAECYRKLDLAGVDLKS